MTTSPSVDLTTGVIRPGTYRLLKPLVRQLVRLVFGLHTDGIDHVPTSGPFILVSNHLHNLDPIFLIVATPGHVRFMAKSELFTVPVLRRVIAWSGAFPINRGKVDRTSIRHAQEVLRQGYQLGIFPEGNRSKAMQIETVKAGAGMFAMRGDVTVVPCGIIGSERLPFNGSKQHKRTELANRTYAHRGVLLRYGEPFTVPPQIGGKRTTAEAAALYMMRRVADLLPEPYRGIYASDADTPPTAS